MSIDWPIGQIKYAVGTIAPPLVVQLWIYGLEKLEIVDLKRKKDKFTDGKEEIRFAIGLAMIYLPCLIVSR